MRAFIILKKWCINSSGFFFFFRILSHLSFLRQILEFVTAFRKGVVLQHFCRIFDTTYLVWSVARLQNQVTGGGLKCEVLLWDEWPWLEVPSDLKSCCQCQLMLFHLWKADFPTLTGVTHWTRFFFFLFLCVTCPVYCIQGIRDHPWPLPARCQ